MKVLIIGGGIGGLTAALCLHGAGMEVVVCESVPEIKPLGVGINLLPHSMRVLSRVGLLERIAEHAVETAELSYFNKFGQRFWSEPRGQFAGYKWPQFSVHRGVLQYILFDAVRETLGPDAVRTNHHLDHFEQNDEGVVAHFVDRATGEMIHEERADLLVGADGINSVVRQQLYPDEGPPVYSENVLYRGTTMMPPFLAGNVMAMIGSMQQKMVVYPIAKPDVDGRVLTNWVGNLNEGQSTLTARDWNREADKDRLLDLYKTWQFDWLDVPQMMAGSGKVYEFPMSDRNPLDRWTFGRVTLLGDAAHPMYPIGSNGASQAILDADALTRALTSTTDPLDALTAYDRERVPATAKVVLQNRAKGPDQILDLMEDRFPTGFQPDEIPHDELAEVMDHYKRVAGFDVQSLNQLT